MSAAELLNMLMAHGYRLTLAGDALRLQGPKSALTENMRQAIRQHKAALMTLLTAQETPQAAAAAPQPAVAAEALAVPLGARTELDEAGEERAALLEYAGGMPRAWAETLARHGPVIALPPCQQCQCEGFAYLYEDGHLRCPTNPAHSTGPSSTEARCVQS